MKKLFYLLSTSIVFISCSPKFHGDARLYGEWQSLNNGVPDIYFDSTYYFIILKDSSGKTSYRLNYKVENEKIIAYAKNFTFSINEILILNTDTLVLQGKNANDVVYYIKKTNKTEQRQ